VKWAEETSDTPMSSKAFAAALQEHGFQPAKIRNARHYRGLRLRTIADDIVTATVGATSNMEEADVNLDS
jgi:hypothetical protein